MKQNLSRIKRKLRVRSKVSGTEARPRLTLFKSNKHLFAQLIDDQAGKTIVSVGDKEESGKKSKVSKRELYFESGVSIAQKALKKGIKTAVFDRSGYRYHGLVAQFADGARKGGLIF